MIGNEAVAGFAIQANETIIAGLTFGLLNHKGEVNTDALTANSIAFGISFAAMSLKQLVPNANRALFNRGGQGQVR